MGYWIPVSKKERRYDGSLKDAYTDAAKSLLAFYRMAGEDATKLIMKGSHEFGVPIYDTATGQAYSHYVVFADYKNPKRGYEEVSYSKRNGARRVHKLFPKTWFEAFGIKN